MKRCPECDEQIQRRAIVCRFCSYRFPPEHKPPFQWGGLAIVAGLALLLWVTSSLRSTSPDSAQVAQPAAIAAIPEAPINDPKKCEKIIRVVERRGIVRSRPDIDRVDVDELRWLMLPAQEKSVVLQMLYCAAHRGRSIAQGERLDRAVVYGWRSGKRLAMIGRAGITYD